MASSIPDGMAQRAVEDGRCDEILCVRKLDTDCWIGEVLQLIFACVLICESCVREEP